MTIIDRMLNKKIISELDSHFTRFITELTVNVKSTASHPALLLGIALVSRFTGMGHICLDLNKMADTALTEKSTDSTQPILCPKITEWVKVLRDSPAVGSPGDFAPLILDKNRRLYLHRYWKLERNLADKIIMRIINPIDDILPDKLKELLDRLFPFHLQQDKTDKDENDKKNKKDKKEIDRQKLAALAAVTCRFSVISGGPGTGKTYTAAKILILLLQLEIQLKLEQEKEETQKEIQPLHIILTAPTGKAAARLSDSINTVKTSLSSLPSLSLLPYRNIIINSLPEHGSTIHRLLSELSNKRIPEPDVVLVDEASMVDLSLMSRLVSAIPDHCRLILLGDKDQLSSVEAGAVLGDICAQSHSINYSEHFCKTVKRFTGYILNSENVENLPKKPKIPEKISCLRDSIIILKKNYRFKDKSNINSVSQAISKGNAEKAIRILRHSKKDIIWVDQKNTQDFSKHLAKRIIQGFSPVYKNIKTPEDIFNRFNDFRLLCALRKGPYGVISLNKWIEKLLKEQGLINPNHHFYEGRPIMITKNDYNVKLFNGDVGIMLPELSEELPEELPDTNTNANAKLTAFFQRADNSFRKFSPFMLPEHETVYAMTVHKSQGSEFNKILLLLPDKPNNVLTRQLLYTGITRAREMVEIWGREEVLRDAILRCTERSSGLKDALWS